MDNHTDDDDLSSDDASQVPWDDQSDSELAQENEEVALFSDNDSNSIIPIPTTVEPTSNEPITTPQDNHQRQIQFSRRSQLLATRSQR